jgi:ribosomal protein L37E
MSIIREGFFMKCKETERKKCPKCERETFIVETARCYLCGYGIPTKEEEMIEDSQLYKMFVGKIT